MKDQELPVESQQSWEEQMEEKKNKGLWWKITLICIAALVLLAAVAGVIIWRVNDFYVWIDPCGNTEVTIEYGQEYQEPGATAWFNGTRLLKDGKPIPVQASGEVNNRVVGDYEILYTTYHEINLLVFKFTYRQELKRIVHVVDTQAPVISLSYTDGGYTVPGEAYQEEGYRAEDGYDGDLTHLVQSREENGKMIYTVADSSGNVATVERQIVYYDPVPPTITLQGRSDISIAVDGNYSEAGFVATDNVDGDITANVVVTGTVDTSTPGTYKLEYTVYDSFKNVASVTRIIRVYNPVVDPDTGMPDMPAGDGAATVEPNGKVIYLTFDDGPSAHTARLLDILDKYNVKATFFVVNSSYMYLLPRMAASGHTIAMHAYSHDYSRVYASDEAYFNDLYAIQNLITAQTGLVPTLLRFPGGSSNTVSRKYCPGIITRVSGTLTEMGYHYFDWNVDSKDASTGKSTQAVINNVIGGCKRRNYSVVLQHDIFGFSVDAVESIIQWGLANGYTFLPLDSSSPTAHQGIQN